jgi:enoyl-CoA hydratase/carnithine racemase
VAKFIETTIRDGVGRLVLCRPEKRNALCGQLVDEGIAAIEGLVAANVSIATLEAVGPVFCAGDDISAGELGRSGDSSARNFVHRFASAPIFWVAVVGGPAVGSGVALLAACPIALSSESSWFQLPERRLGIFPDFVIDYLRPLIGPRRTLELVMSGRRLNAQEALQAGLLTEVVGEELLPKRASEWVETLTDDRSYTDRARLSWARPNWDG